MYNVHLHLHLPAMEKFGKRGRKLCSSRELTYLEIVLHIFRIFLSRIAETVFFHRSTEKRDLTEGK
jgi:hypothetical protein